MYRQPVYFRLSLPALSIIFVKAFKTMEK